MNGHSICVINVVICRCFHAPLADMLREFIRVPEY